MSDSPRRHEPRDPYVPVSIDELQDTSLPAEALLLLLRLRRECARDLTDGVISQRTFDSVAAFYGYERRNLTRNLRILSSAARLKAISGAFVDANFARVCLSAEQRLSERARWRRAKRTQLGPLSTVDSTEESLEESPDDSSVIPPFHLPPSSFYQDVHVEVEEKNGYDAEIDAEALALAEELAE